MEQDYLRDGPKVIPMSNSEISVQTPIRDQEDRGTCVCFASLANLEVPIKAQSNKPVDLSEQNANWLYMLNLGNDWCKDGLKTTLAAQYLSIYGVCTEGLCRYENATRIGTHCNGKPSPGARKKAQYGIDTYALIDNLGMPCSSLVIIGLRRYLM
jgi:hypothetical protein